MSDVAIRFPTDAYLHVGAPREWWWHIGTLQAGARRFGFEINAAGFSAAEPPVQPSCFSQVMLSDPTNQKHYKKTAAHAFDPTWAEPDPSRPWYARIGDLGSNDWVFMQSVAGIDSLTVQASFTDDPSGEIVRFDLRMTQRGAPLYVWGSGVAANIVPTGKTPLERNNYYYSYTNLRVDGTVTIGKSAIAVAGVTWMDHEYGAFGAGTRWALQDAQLSNGVSITNSAVGDFVLEAGKPIATLATILENGVSKLALLALTTPSKPWIYQGTTYFLHWQLDIPGHGAVLEFEALMKDQMFPADQRPIYEGAASVAGRFDGLAVVGTGWIEQAIAPLQPSALPAPGRGTARLQSPA
jgi:predicted secreted hydrolase